MLRAHGRRSTGTRARVLDAGVYAPTPPRALLFTIDPLFYLSLVFPRDFFSRASKGRRQAEISVDLRSTTQNPVTSLHSRTPIARVHSTFISPHTPSQHPLLSSRRLFFSLSSFSNPFSSRGQRHSSRNDDRT